MPDRSPLAHAIIAPIEARRCPVGRPGAPGQDFVVDGALGVNTGGTPPAADLHVRRPDNQVAMVAATGSCQGSGQLFVGRDNDFGGGIAYHGSSSTGVGENDRVTFFRRDGGADSEAFSYARDSSDVRFATSVTTPALSTSALTVGDGGTGVTRLQTGQHPASRCSGDAMPYSGTVSFGSPAFASPPRVFLQPNERDNAGCTSIRITCITTTGFSYYAFAGIDASKWNCLQWLAIGN